MGEKLSLFVFPPHGDTNPDRDKVKCKMKGNFVDIFICAKNRQFNSSLNEVKEMTRRSSLVDEETITRSSYSDNKYINQQWKNDIDIAILIVILVILTLCIYLYVSM